MMLRRIASNTKARGTHIEKSDGDAPRSLPPFSRPLGLRSLPIYHQCAAYVPPPHFQFLEFFCHFCLVLAKNVAL